MGRNFAAAVLLVLLGVPARSQVDPSRRLQLEAGYEQGMAQPGPKSPYLYLYLNRPSVFHSSDTLRMAIAPVYVDAELGIPKFFGPLADAGLGLSGGGYAFGQTEVFRGDEKRGESFVGHGGGPSFTAYPRLVKIGPVPVHGVLRVAASYADYRRNSSTAPQFVLPQSEWTATFRGGLRLGGQPPGLDKSPAGEASLWWESRAREHTLKYGYNGDRVTQGQTNLFWTRLFINYKMKDGTRWGAGTSFGRGTGVDRFSAFRLGGMLLNNSEFPMPIPGYFGQEIAAREFAHAWLRAGVPIEETNSLVLNFYAAGASITPAAGTDAGGAQHLGLGTGLEFVPHKGSFRGMFSFGYAPTAVRGDSRGGRGIAFSMEYDFTSAAERTAHPQTGSQQGLRWMLGPFSP